MRPINEGTMAILKSQNLTGQNGFRHSLRLEGVDYYTPITETLVNLVKASGDSADFVIRADGKALVSYSIGPAIYLKVVDKEQDLMTIPDIADGGELFYTCNANAGDNHKMIKLRNGKILLIISEGGIYPATPKRTSVYISENGLGTDFVFLSYALSQSLTSESNYKFSQSVGKPAQLKNGRIILFAFGTVAAGFSTNGSTMTALVSDDNGLTWIKKGEYFDSGNYTRTYFRNIAVIEDETKSLIFGTVGAWYLNAKEELIWSEDGGDTFTYSEQPFTNFIPTTRALVDFAIDLGGNLFMLIDGIDEKADLYRMQASTSITKDQINNMSNWILVKSGIPRSANYNGHLIISPKGLIHYLHYFNYGIRNIGMVRDEYSTPLKISSISISKGKGGANSAVIQASNKDGALNPKNPDSPLYGILKTNKQIIIKQGYGEDLIETFTGMIDDFDMSTWPQTTGIALRDNLKKALDQTVTYGTQHTIEFNTQPIETIVGYLCYLANIDVGTIEPTGLSVAMTFSWCSYADAFQQLGDLASFEWGCDSYGKFYFRRDYQPDNMYVAYTFEEGVDLETLKYTISDKDLYAKVAVFGKSGDTVISYEAPFLDAAEYNILPQKILKIDATEASTMDALLKIAERALSMMQSRTAIIQFSSIAIPWLEVGDFVGIYERSTGAASIYRLADISFQMDTDTFTMSGTAYYYGDSIVPGELPTEVATQIPAPSVNLIPEMTSNVSPSGVARASSVYSAAYEPWQAFNSHSDDLYWNAITNTGWIEYQFPEKMIVDKYMLKSRQLDIYNDAMPRDWTFQGFDGTQWINLDTRTAQTGWGVNESRTYLFANTVAYSKYRLNVSKNEGYIRVQLEQLAMYYGGGA